MLQELKRKSLKGHAASIIIALALAAGLLWGTGFGAFKAIGGPKPLDLSLIHISAHYRAGQAERKAGGGKGVSRRCSAM